MLSQILFICPSKKQKDLTREELVLRGSLGDGYPAIHPQASTAEDWKQSYAVGSQSAGDVVGSSVVRRMFL